MPATIRAARSPSGKSLVGSIGWVIRLPPKRQFGRRHRRACGRVKKGIPASGSFREEAENPTRHAVGVQAHHSSLANLHLAPHGSDAGCWSEQGSSHGDDSSRRQKKESGR